MSSRQHDIDSFLKHSDEQIEKMLESGENAPAPIPGTTAMGSLKPVSRVEAAERRRMMSTMLANGAERDAIYRAFEQKYGMTQGAVKVLISKVYAMWGDEDSHSAKYARNAAKRRLHQHIAGARKDRKWTAVANLEKVLSEVEGTVVTDEESKPSDEATRVNDAILMVLNQKDPQQVRVMIERQRLIVEQAPAEPPQLSETIDTEGV